jgi:hypothetical protein
MDDTQIEAAISALEKLDRICNEIFDRWDKDQRSGKLLTALAGLLPGYRADVDEVRAALSAAAPRQAEGWREPVTYLVKEVGGMWSAFEHELRYNMGHTNYNCVAVRLAAVEALLREPASNGQ